MARWTVGAAGRTLAAVSVMVVLWCAVLGIPTTGSSAPMRTLEQPASLLLAFTTATRGVLEPCGCSAEGGMSGGLAARATLMRHLRQRPGAVVLLVDSGDAILDSDHAALFPSAMRAIGYAAAGLGVGELLNRDAFLDGARAAGLPVVNSLPKTNRLPQWVRHDKICLVGERRVAVLGVSPSFPALAPPQLAEGLMPTLRELRSRADLVVLLSQVGLQPDEYLARQQTDDCWIDLVIGNADAASLREPKVIGRTWILPTSTRGTEVGLVEVRWEGGQPRYRFERLPVDARYEPDPAIQKQIDDFRAAQAEALRAASQQATLAPAAERFRLDYVSAPDCGACHPKAYEAWRTHRHSRAVRTLNARKRLVPECLTCHSEVFRRTEKLTWRDDLVDGVQCGTCHGPGVIHRLLKGKGGITRHVDEATCKTCHNQDRDPRFDYTQAIQRIRHW